MNIFAEITSDGLVDPERVARLEQQLGQLESRVAALESRPDTEPDPDPEPQFPDSTTTGVRPGTNLTLRDGALVVTEDGTVIEDMHVNGTVTVDADNVTIRNTLVQTGTSLYPIRVGRGVTGTVIEDVEIDNRNGTGIGIFVQGDQVTIRRADIHSCEDGLRIQGDDVLLEDSYIHHLHRQPGGHHDCVQIRSGRNVALRNNSLQAYNPATGDVMNSAIQIGSLSGTTPIAGLRVIGNLMNGGNFTVNGGSSGDVADSLYSGNRFGREFRYGPVGNLHSGDEWDHDTNVWHDTSQPV